MDLQIFENYFKNLADQHVDIAGFAHIDLFEKQKSTAHLNGVDGLVLIMETFSVKNEATNNDQIFDRIPSAFLILGKVDNRNALQADRTTLLQFAFEVSEDIKKRLKLDEERGITLLTGLNISSFNSEKIGPELNNRFGWRTEFNFLQYNDFEVNTDKWDDL